MNLNPFRRFIPGFPPRAGRRPLAVPLEQSVPPILPLRTPAARAFHRSLLAQDRWTAAMIPLASSNLASAGYDRTTRRLRIKFCSGGIYEYVGVPPETFAGLRSAASPGKYFRAHIKGQYSSQRVA